MRASPRGLPAPEALASHICKTGMSGEDVAELLCHEAARYERESQELH